MTTPNLFARVLAERREADFNTYRDPKRISQDHGIEVEMLGGGYSYRQILELIQNGADAILEANENGVPCDDARIVVRLDSNWLHVANTGAPVSEEGLVALLSSHNSPKRGNQIGRFGLGFKSLLKLNGRIFLFSKQNGNVEFNPDRCRREISQKFNVPETEAPGLRLAWLVDKGGEPELERLWKGQFGWAETLVSAEIGRSERSETLHEILSRELAAFRAEFLLFFPASLEIELHAPDGNIRRLSVEKSANTTQLVDAGEKSAWHVASRDVRITDEKALDDATDIHRRDTVPISWAFPLDGKTQEAGRFWAFFPTKADTKIAGILNAPWKLNTDRTAPIPGDWNRTLMGEAAKLVADTLRSLFDAADPGRLLDAFPRRLESNDEIAKPLVDALWRHLANSESLPDATGSLRKPGELYRFPKEADANAIESWMELASPENRRRFAHPSCLDTPNRKGRLDALAENVRQQDNPNTDPPIPNLAVMDFAEWLGMTASPDAAQAKKALRFAAKCKNAMGFGNWCSVENNGLFDIKIIPTATGGIESANNVIIGNEVFGNRVPVAPALLADDECAEILRRIFNIPTSADKRSWDERLERALNVAVTGGKGSAWKTFWRELREAPVEFSGSFARDKRRECRLLRSDGEWRPPHEVLLPGRWVAGDDAENAGFLIDKKEHPAERDQPLLEALGVSDSPLDCRRVYMGALFDEGVLNLHRRTEFYAKSEGNRGAQRIEVEFPLCHKIILSLRGRGRTNAIKGLVRLLEEKNIPCPLSYYDRRYARSARLTYHPILLLMMKCGTFPGLIATDDQQLMHYVASDNDNVLPVNPDIKKFLIAELKARDLKDVLRPTHDGTGTTVNFSREFPEFSNLLKSEKTQIEHVCRIVSNLKIRIDETYKPVPVFYCRKEQCLFIDRYARVRLTQDEFRRVVLREIDNAGWIDFEVIEGPEQGVDVEEPPPPTAPEVGERRRKVREHETLPERLFAATGNSEARLRDALGGIGKADFTKSCAPLKLAELFLTQYGTAALSQLSGAMQLAGLNPPARWGSDEARQFVAEIGFPPEYAASESARREAEDWISGPIELKPLHDFQEEVRGNLKELIRKSESRRRAVVCLPTGGGKTRVAVEAAVEFVLKPKGAARSVIWIAQTDELCEQAVQAFRQVWLNKGAERTDLRICRLWGGTRTPDIQDTSHPVVVVASIQTLNSRANRDFLIKLQKPGLLVVDECHHGITKSYTNVLRWLDAEAPMPWEKQEDITTKKEPPIIGLSATPFRGDVERNKVETMRLAKRYDNRVFPQGQEQLDRELLQKGVLARITTKEIDSGIPLTAAEESQISSAELFHGKNMAFYVGNVLGEVDKRLAGIESRNRQMVDFIKNADEQHILFFANSVDHAREMAARLTLEGIPAAPISDQTPRSARRQFVDDFQNGKIRVLCNYRILTTGFDAPKTDMILISRNIFSPVLYMQIVGRGLRGPKNGGTESCRVVTVRDNLGRFEKKRAYHYFLEYYQDYLNPSGELPRETNTSRSDPDTTESPSENPGTDMDDVSIKSRSNPLQIHINWESLGVNRPTQTICERSDNKTIVEFIKLLLETFKDPMREQLLGLPIIRFPLKTNRDDFPDYAKSGICEIPGTNPILYFCGHSDQLQKKKRLDELVSNLTLPDRTKFSDNSVTVSINAMDVV